MGCHRVSAPVVGYVGMTHLGLCSAVAAASKGFVTARDRSRCGVGRAARRPANCRWSSRASTISCASTARASAFRRMPPSLAPATWSMSRPTCRPTIRGKSSLAVLDALAEFTLANTRPDAVVVVLSQVPPGYTRARQQRRALALLSGRDADFRPRRRTRDAARALHRRLPRSGKAAAGGDARLSAELRLPDPADALRKRRAVQDRHQLLPGFVHLRRQHARRTVRGDRRRLVGDRAGAQARPPHRRATPISRPASASPAAIWSAILRPWCAWRTASAAMPAWSKPGSPTAGTAKAGRPTPSARSVLDKNPDATVAVWGLAYKENTASIKNSPSLATIAALPDARLVLHDPVVNASVVAACQGHRGGRSAVARSRAPMR